MTKRGIISFILVSAVVGIGVAILYGEHKNNNSESVAIESKRNIVHVTDLHKDILRLIISEKETVYKITPQDAEKELENRLGKDLQVDKESANVKLLPFDIVRLIAKSPASIAGIKPKMATNELVRRYLSIDLTDSEDVNSSILLEALQHRGEKKAIKDWAINEDAEAVEAFLKEEADKDPSSVANFALGLKKLDSDRDIAMSYMDRYARHVQGDAFDNPNKEAGYRILIEAIKKLK